jgi:Protein of unknown function (DUF3570)
VVATERAVRRRRAREEKRVPALRRFVPGHLGVLRQLPWLAAGLGALFAKDALGQSSIDTRFLFYKESNGRTQVLDPVVLLHHDLGTLGQLDLQLAYDSISGASPSGGYPTSDMTTSASGKTSTNGSVPQVDYKDTRKSVSLSYGRKFGAHLPTVDLSYSKENDYTARSFGISDAWTTAEGRGTLHLGVSFASDIVAPVTNHLQFPKRENGYALGWTWILDERTLFDVSASLQKNTGDLDDPYKIVPLGPFGTTLTLPDHRPDSRNRWALFAKFGHYYLWDGALKVSYRYYWDDWSVKAHTLDVLYDQKLDSDWIVSPRIRLYTQSGASFYQSRFVAPEMFMSSDYRLSPFWNALGGLTLTHKVTDDLSVNLGGTYQIQLGRDRVTAVATTPGRGAGATVSAADLNVGTIVLGLTYRY